MEAVYAAHLKIRGSKLYLTLNSRGGLEDLGAYLVRRETDPSVKERQFLPFQRIFQSEQEIKAVLDTSVLPLDKADWAVMVSGRGEIAEKQRADASFFQPVILSGKLRALLILGDYQIRRSGQILFPMGSAGHQMILRCRPETKYDGQGTRFREFLAYGLYRLLRPLWKKKRVWIIYEKYCVSAQDNGFYFFQYCMEHLEERDKKRIFFVLDRNSEQWDEIKSYRKNVLPFMSFRHMLYMLAASLYVASDSGIHGYLWQPRPNLISREINRHEIYFLQHGVLGMKRVEDLFGKNGVSPVTYFTVSSKYEQDIVVREFGYARENVPITGLARWDVLENKAEKGAARILVMPTWRSWLEYSSDEEFCGSDYYRHYMSLLENRRLLSVLRETGTELIFYIHPKLRGFMSNFHSDSGQVTLVSFGQEPLNELLMKCSMMVTDYSSACWDVYYQEKPVLFYQFDLEPYMETNGSYMDMETELFGERCTEESALVERLEAYIAEGFQEKEAFAAMRDHYFAYRDHHNCERIYAYIRGDAQEK